MPSAAQRALVVRMSLIEAILEQTQRELNGRKKQSNRVRALRTMLDKVETALSDLQRAYYDVTLTQGEYDRIAHALIIFEGVMSGSVAKDEAGELVSRIVGINPELRKYL